MMGLGSATAGRESLPYPGNSHWDRFGAGILLGSNAGRRASVENEATSAPSGYAPAGLQSSWQTSTSGTGAHTTQHQQSTMETVSGG